ncbi:hypothetical protein D3C81_1861430 [compost metagenome]
MGIFAFNVYFAEHRKSYLIVKLAKALNLLLRPRLLSCKLVARKTEHDKLLILVFAVQLLKAFIMWS